MDAGVADPDPTTAVSIPRLDPQFFKLEKNFFYPLLIIVKILNENARWSKI
jgi:hypothetical protein